MVAVGDPVADVLERGEPETDHEAHDRQRPAADPPPGQHREPGADHAGRPPAGHLPRGPRSLAEEEVRRQPRDRADREAGAASERVAGDEHDVGRRLDVRERGERDPPERRERRQRPHQRDDPGIGSDVLVPGEAAGERYRQDRERAELPGHAVTSASALATRAIPSSGGERATGAAEDPRGLGGEVGPPREDLARRPVRDHRALPQQHDALGERGHELRVVGGDEHRRVEFAEQRRQLVLAPAVHAAGRLVEADHGRLARSAGRRARSRGRGAASPRPTGRADGGPRARGRRARRSRARPARPPARPGRGSGSRSGSGAAARPGRRSGPCRGSGASARPRGAEASTCRRRCDPSARRARPGRRDSETPRRMAGPRSISCQTRSSRQRAVFGAPARLATPPVRGAGRDRIDVRQQPS